MSNKKLFSNKNVNKSVSKLVTRVTNTTNEAGGIAYKLSDKAALAQYAMTGTLNGTYYASDEEQLKKTLELANKADVKFVAKLAVYARQKGLMKDMPAVLAAVVASKDTDLLAAIFDRVIDSPKMLRNFVQIIRSGAVGRKSLGTRPKRLIQKYLEKLTDEQLFKADVGNDPSLQDIIKLVHPKPSKKSRSALYAYLLDREYDARSLLPLAKEFERFKKEMKGEIPDVPFQMLTALPLTDAHWKQIAENATWTQTRMNLNTFQRHGVLADSKLVNMISARLEDSELIKKARVFPYQLFAAYKNVTGDVPQKIVNSLQKAADASTESVPDFGGGKVYVMVDVSGSMSSAVTGNRGTASSKVRCIDVAALVAAAVLRKNAEAEVIAFSDDVILRDRSGQNFRLNPMDSIMTNADKLANLPSGGTNCSSALRYVNQKLGKGDLVIYVSDNQSWVDSNPGSSYYNRLATATMNEWNIFKARNPKAKMVCIDVQPAITTQVHDREDILNIGGFSDNCFEVIARFVELGNNKDLWIKTIESVTL
jgi:60 kDa SS-A/Ro ribonucleoprotein